MLTIYQLSGLTEPRSRALLAKAPTRLLVASTDTSKYEDQDGFIRLPSRKGHRNAEEAYRSITQDDDHNSDSSSSSEGDDASSDEGDGSHVLTAHQETLKSLEQALKSDPTAADNWLSLLNQTLSTIPLTSKNATQARCEITISILTRALSASPRKCQK